MGNYEDSERGLPNKAANRVVYFVRMKKPQCYGQPSFIHLMKFSACRTVRYVTLKTNIWRLYIRELKNVNK